MVIVNIDLPKELNKKVLIFAANNGHTSKPDAVIRILELFEEE